MNTVHIEYADGSTEIVSSALTVAKRFREFGGPMVVTVDYHPRIERFWAALGNRLPENTLAEVPEEKGRPATKMDLLQFICRAYQSPYWKIRLLT